MIYPFITFTQCGKCGRENLLKISGPREYVNLFSDTIIWKENVKMWAKQWRKWTEGERKIEKVRNREWNSSCSSSALSFNTFTANKVSKNLKSKTHHGRSASYALVWIGKSCCHDIQSGQQQNMSPNAHVQHLGILYHLLLKFPNR